LALEGRIRPISICVIRRNDRILVFQAHDSVKQQTYYRPLGGGIEFGEHSQQTIVREIREEIRAELQGVRFLGVLENVFTLEGRPGHEIVLVYEADLVDERLYTLDGMTGNEDDGTPFKVVWMSLATFYAGEAPLYPDGLLELIGSERRPLPAP